MKFFLVILSLLVQASVYGKAFGVHGATFDIKEEDLLDCIEARLHSMQLSGELEEHQGHLKRRVINSAQNPKPVLGITRAVKDNHFFYDPTFVVQEDLKTDTGITFRKKGERINPLDTVSLTQTLIFLDGTDKEQVEWAIGQSTANKKYILINGSPFKLMEVFEVPFYFDQEGRLTKKLGIKHVPASVIQEGKKLEIQEHKI